MVMENQSQEEQIAQLLNDLKIIPRTENTSERMVIYRRIFSTFCSVTQYKDRNRGTYIYWMEKYGIGNLLFPRISSPLRIRLLINILDAMVLDHWLDCNGYETFSDPSVVRRFDVFIIPKLVNKGNMFIWQEDKVISNWSQVESVSNSTLSLPELHCSMVQDIGKVNTESQKTDISTKPAVGISRKRKADTEFYTNTASIFKHMFNLPNAWSKEQIVSAVEKYYNDPQTGREIEPLTTTQMETMTLSINPDAYNKSKIAKQSAMLFRGPQQSFLHHEPTGLKIIQLTDFEDKEERYVVGIDIMKSLRPYANYEAKTQTDYIKNIDKSLRRVLNHMAIHPQKIKLEKKQTIILNYKELDLLLNWLKTKCRDVTWGKPAEILLKSSEYADLQKQLSTVHDNS